MGRSPSMAWLGRLLQVFSQVAVQLLAEPSQGSSRKGSTPKLIEMGADKKIQFFAVV